MLPIYDEFDTILKSYLGETNRLYMFMTGILLVDARQVGAKEYILKYISDFDRESGAYIDFYLPGYVSGEEEYKVEGMFDDSWPVNINGKIFYFQPFLYEKAQEEYEYKWGVKKSRYPMLILVDVVKENNRYVTKQKLVIELKEYMHTSNPTVEELFYGIFDYASSNTDMGLQHYRFRFRVLLGCHVPKIKEFLFNQIPGFVFNLITSGMGN